MPTRCEHWLHSVPASGEGASGLTESSCASQKDPGGRSQQGCSFVSLGSGEGVLGSVGSGPSAQTPRPAGRERLLASSASFPHWVQSGACLACRWGGATADGRPGASEKPAGPLSLHPSDQ